MLRFAHLFGDFVDLKVLEEVDSQLARDGDVDVAIFVEVFGDDLGTYAGSAVVGKRYPSEFWVAVDLVGIDYVGIVGARVVAIVAAIALTCDEIGRAVTAQISELEGMGLGKRFVDGVAGGVDGVIE